MPKTWHDRHAVNKIEGDSARDFYRSIVADKKPYFMRYIYPALMKQYNTYIKNTNRNALREFQMTVDELRSIPSNELTERQSDFLKYYDYRMPVGVGNCVVNRICRRFEEEFDGCVGKYNACVGFDYRIMHGESDYSAAQYNAVKKLYDDFNKRIRNYAVFAEHEKVDEGDLSAEISIMKDEFRRECDAICQNRGSLCSIILDLCYTKSSTKKFAWSMCGQDIINNLLAKQGYTIAYPTLDQDGDITYGGEKFSISYKKVEVNV